MQKISQDFIDRSLNIQNRELLLRFESLGHDCELGLLQREFGAEPLGLFRWGGTHVVRLIEALDNDFLDLGNAEYNEVTPIGHEYYLTERRYGMSRHTGISVGSEENPKKIFDKQLKITKFLLRKFRDTLQISEKIFVYKDFDNASDSIILDLSRALRRYGPAKLLFVHELGSPGEPPTLRRLSNDVWLAHLDRFGGSTGVWNISTEHWLIIMREVLSQSMSL